MTVRAGVQRWQRRIHPPHEHLRMRGRVERLRGAGGHRGLPLLPALHAAPLLQLQQRRRRLVGHIQGINHQVKLDTGSWIPEAGSGSLPASDTWLLPCYHP